MRDDFKAGDIVNLWTRVGDSRYEEKRLQTFFEPLRALMGEDAVFHTCVVLSGFEAMCLNEHGLFCRYAE